MCGIVGYVGSEPAAKILLAGLAKLEYRGYDSAGLAVRDGDSPIEVVKAKGRLKVLKEMTKDGETLSSHCGIGHTRWATHGEPSTENAHPHYSDDMAVVAVHNGIIENYVELKEKLLRNGYSFYSETDTEVATKLIDYYHKKYHGTPVESLARAMMRIRGSYALAVMFKEHPGEIYATRQDSPMIIGVADGASYLASDVPAILKYTRSVYYIDNMEIARLTRGGVDFFTVDEEPIRKELTTITWDAESAEKGGYEHFMMKEIHEQPKAVTDTLNSLLKGGEIDLGGSSITDEQLQGTRMIHIVACGSAYHVGMVAQYVIEKLARIPVRVEIASEFRYRKPLLTSDELVVIISQSGETADSLAALREAKAQGVPTLAIVNVVGSTIAREADSVIYTCAGPEIAVATTKAYSTQLIVCYLLAMKLAQAKGTVKPEEDERLLTELRELPEVLQHKGCFLHRPWHRLCGGARGQPQAQGNQLCSLRGLCGRGAQAWHHQSDRESHAGGKYTDPAGAV